MPRRVEFQGTVHEFPDSATDDQIRSALQGMAQPQQPAQPRPSGGWLDSIGNTVKNWWDQVNPVEGVKGMAAAASNPAGAVQGYGQQTAEIERKMEESFKQGRYAEGFRHGLGYILNGIPGVGATLDKAGDQAQAGDVSGAVGTTAGLATNMIGPGKALDAFKGGAAAVKGVAVNALEKSAAENYRSVLLPSSKKLVPEAETTAAMMAKERPVALTREQLLEQARREKAVAGPQAANAYAAKPDMTVPETQPIFDEIQRMRDRHVNVKGVSGVEVNKPLAQALDRLEQNLTDMQDRMGNIPAETLDDFRDKLFRGSVDATGHIKLSAPASAKKIEMGLGGSIKRVLDSKYPDAAQLNDTYRLWKSAEQFLEDARRREIASKSGIVTGSSQGFGALAQRMLPRPVREIPQRIVGVFDSVAWNTASGAFKQTVANEMAKGNWPTVELLLKDAVRTGQAAQIASPKEATVE